jgi:CRP-like cAMP-binding protein
METLRKQLHAECGYRMKDETMDKFLSLMTEMKLKKGQQLIPYNTIDDNIYIVKEGIIRTVYFDGFNEVTFAFAMPGTLKISYYSFCKGIPSFSKYVACCDSVILKVSKAQFTGLMEQSNDFAQWVSYMSLEQLFFHEMKREVVNGDAKERFVAMIENRPEIIEKVSSRIVASYIGVTPQYMCRLKKEFAYKLKK